MPQSESESETSPARNRVVCLVLLCATVLAGLGSRRFGASLPSLLADNAGDALWTVAAYLTICLVRPAWPPWYVFLSAVGVSFLVEFSQLIDWPPLVAIRQDRIGRLFLGQGFLWADLPRYLVGAAAAWVVDQRALFPSAALR